MVCPSHTARAHRIYDATITALHGSVKRLIFTYIEDKLHVWVRLPSFTETFFFRIEPSYLFFKCSVANFNLFFWWKQWSSYRYVTKSCLLQRFKWVTKLLNQILLKTVFVSFPFLKFRSNNWLRAWPCWCNWWEHLALFLRKVCAEPTISLVKVVVALNSLFVWGNRRYAQIDSS